MTDKRDAILEAALELFVDRGFHGTAVPAVAERAGVGAGTIYRYFASKEALVNELYRHWKRQAGGYLMEGFAGEVEPRERFHKLWRHMVSFAKEHPRAFRFLELHHHGSYLDEQSLQTERDLTATAARLIAAMQSVGVLRPADPMLLIALIHWGLVGLVQFALQGRLSFDEEHVAAAEDALWDAIRGPAA